jgi:hypothetical protein
VERESAGGRFLCFSGDEFGETNKLGLRLFCTCTDKQSFGEKELGANGRSKKERKEKKRLDIDSDGCRYSRGGVVVFGASSSS